MHSKKSTNTLEPNESELIEKVSPQVVKDLRSALFFMRADDRELWQKNGHRLKGLGDLGRGLWLEWSATSDKFDPQADAKTWESFKPTHTGYKAIFSEAQKLGWINPATLILNNDEVENSYKQSSVESSTDVGALFNKFILTSEMVEKMANAKFVIPDIIVEGSLTVYAAPANGGKSALFRYFCEQMIGSGKTILYVNSDAGASDLKKHYAHAQKYGYKVLAPDACLGKSTQDVLDAFMLILKNDVSCNDYVFILDTLKKFTDVINKSQAKEFYKLLRALTVKGATICLLGHCNKYKDENGLNIFEGTADLRNDVDNLIYFDSYLNEKTNILEVTTRPDKTRADFHPVSFNIHRNNNLKVTPAKGVRNVIPLDDREIIDIVKLAISEGIDTQSEIIRYIKEKLGIGEKKIKARLCQYSNEPKKELNKLKTGKGRGVRYEIA